MGEVRQGSVARKRLQLFPTASRHTYGQSIAGVLICKNPSAPGQWRTGKRTKKNTHRRLPTVLRAPSSSSYPTFGACAGTTNTRKSSGDSCLKLCRLQLACIPIMLAAVERLPQTAPMCSGSVLALLDWLQCWGAELQAAGLVCDALTPEHLAGRPALPACSCRRLAGGLPRCHRRHGPCSPAYDGNDATTAPAPSLVYFDYRPAGYHCAFLGHCSRISLQSTFRLGAGGTFLRGALSYMAPPPLAGVGLSAVHRTDDIHPSSVIVQYVDVSVPALFVGVGSFSLVPCLLCLTVSDAP